MDVGVMLVLGFADGSNAVVFVFTSLVLGECLCAVSNALRF
jgi:hypothetical protein